MQHARDKRTPGVVPDDLSKYRHVKARLKWSLNCLHHTLCLRKACLQFKLSESCKVKVHDVKQAGSTTLILLSDVQLHPCRSFSILLRSSLHLSSPLCLLLLHLRLSVFSALGLCCCEEARVGFTLSASCQLNDWLKLPLLEWCHHDSAILDTVCVAVCVLKCMEVSAKLAHMWLEQQMSLTLAIVFTEYSLSVGFIENKSSWMKCHMQSVKWNWEQD